MERPCGNVNSDTRQSVLQRAKSLKARIGRRRSASVSPRTENIVIHVTHSNVSVDCRPREDSLRVICESSSLAGLQGKQAAGHQRPNTPTPNLNTGSAPPPLCPSVASSFRQRWPKPRPLPRRGEPEAQTPLHTHHVGGGTSLSQQTKSSDGEEMKALNSNMASVIRELQALNVGLREIAQSQCAHALASARLSEAFEVYTAAANAARDQIPSQVERALKAIMAEGDSSDLAKGDRQGIRNKDSGEQEKAAVEAAGSENVNGEDGSGAKDSEGPKVGGSKFKSPWSK